MKTFNTKIILTPIEQENQWGYQDKESAKLGRVHFPFKGKVEDQTIEFKKGDEVYYQYGNEVTIEGTKLVLVNPSNLICQK